MKALRPPTLDEVRAAAERIADVVTPTPTVPLELAGRAGGPAELRLKLECLQPIGSFKLRGAANAILSARPADLRGGVTTASAGNMGQGVASCARELGLACRVIVPDHAPRAKLDALERLGAECLPVPFDEWWEAMLSGGHPASRGLFVHPVCDPAVIAGNATIALELARDFPRLEAVVVPFGGGGLSGGIASALRELRPGVPVLAAEVATAAPLSAALAAGEPVEVDYTPSFVDGIGGRSVLPAMWPLVSEVLHGSLVVELADVARAVATLALEAHVVAEGAGAASVAAALSGRAGAGRVAAVVSGGNLDAAVLAAALRGELA